MQDYLTIEQHAGSGIVVVTMNDPSGGNNRTTDQFKTELSALLDRLEQAPVTGVVIRSAKSDFGVGGDVDQIAELAHRGAAATFADSQHIKALFRRIETLAMPVVALIEGMAVGGSFELALACHARFALADDRIRIGFPETTIGLIPGAGGLVRTLHMIGLEAAIPLVAEGRLISPARMLELGMIDGLGENPQQLLDQALDWIAANPTPRKPWDDRRHAVPGGGLFTTPARYLQMQSRVAAANKRGFGRQMAEIAALDALCDCAACGFSDGEVIESRTFARQAVSQEANARIGLALKDKSVLKRNPSRPTGLAAAVMPKTVGVVGAGMMGAGIAYANARVGTSVLLTDVDQASLDRAMAQIVADADRALRRGEYDAAARDDILARITTVETLEALAGCDLVIEAVFEDMALKKTVIAQLAAIVAPDCLIASNTSALSITEIASVSGNPGRFIGLHFFSPVDRMHLVEVVRGGQTSDTTLAAALDYVRHLKKQSITVADSHGFFASRVFQKFIYEAAALIGEGVPAALVENAALQAGYPAGPLALLDDTSLSLSIRVIAGAAAAAAARGEAAENHPGEAVITAMVETHGRAGRRSGAGFYDYRPEGKSLWPGLADLAASDARPSIGEIAERYLTAQCCDVLRALSEGVIRSAAEVNTGAVRAIGFPSWTGGPLRLIEAEGAPVFFSRAQAMADRLGERFRLPFATADDLQRVLEDARRFDTDNTQS